MNVKNLILGIGIVIVFALVLWQGIEAFYPSPQYDKYCKSTDFSYPTKVSPIGIPNCSYSKTLYEQEQQCSLQQGIAIYEYDETGCAISVKECNLCNKKFNEDLNARSRIVFFIAVIVGILALIIGYAILSIEPVGSALIGAGIWSFFYGAVINRRNFTNIWRFLLLLLALIILIWIAVSLNTQKQKKGFWQRLGIKK